MKKILAAVSIAAIAVTTAATAAEKQPATSLSDLGMTFEKARKLSAVERSETLNDLDARVTAMLGDLEGSQKAAAYFLSGEIRFANGRYDDATNAFRSSAKEAKDSPLAADATLGLIQSEEAAGRDAQAEKEWREWLQAHGRTNAAADAMLSRAWNAIRSDSSSLADALLKDARTRFPWIVRDPRYNLANGTTAFIEGRYADVHVQPSGSPPRRGVRLSDRAHRRSGQATAAGSGPLPGSSRQVQRRASARRRHAGEGQRVPERRVVQERGRRIRQRRNQGTGSEHPGRGETARCGIGLSRG
jgi:tetratricopeptide (TPR) repeat protein